MTRAQFARDPREGMRRAQDGGLLITNAQGRPRAILSVPTDERLVHGIDD